MNRRVIAMEMLAVCLATGCGASSGENVASEEGQLDVVGEPSQTPPDHSPAVAAVDVGEEHQLKFISLPGSDAVFVSEVSSGKDSISALDLVEADLALDGDFSAKDVFIALTKPGTAIPQALERLPSGLREQGWARPVVEDALTRDVGYSNSTPACTNSSFTSSTYGGIISHNATWLDDHPWHEYSHYVGYWSATHHYTPRLSATLERHNILQYRGKLCYEQIDCTVGQSCHTAIQGFNQNPTYLAPRISFQYRRPGESSWSTADYNFVARGATKSMNWAFFGNQNERWDWRMETTGGQAQDWFDYMRSYYD